MSDSSAPALGGAAPTGGFPAFQVQQLGPKSANYCLAVFVINEGERIRSQLAKMAPYAGLVDILIADGGSSDGSLQNLAELASFGVKAVLTKTGEGKLSAQMRMAMAYALRENYRGIIVMDGNDKDDPASIPQFVEKLFEGYDHIQGSRFRSGGHAINTPLVRYWAIRLIHTPLISVAARFRYTDSTNGFRGYSARFLADDRVQPFRTIFSRYELHYYLAIRAARLGFRVIEIPVTRAYPRGQKVPTKISPIRGNWNVLVTLVRACFGLFNPPKS